MSLTNSLTIGKPTNQKCYVKQVENERDKRGTTQTDQPWVEQQPYKCTTMANASSLERKLANNAEHIETIYNQTL